jgi:hypothetical protein
VLTNWSDVIGVAAALLVIGLVALWGWSMNQPYSPPCPAKEHCWHEYTRETHEATQRWVYCCHCAQRLHVLGSDIPKQPKHGRYYTGQEGKPPLVGWDKEVQSLEVKKP